MLAVDNGNSPRGNRPFGRTAEQTHKPYYSGLTCSRLGDCPPVVDNKTAKWSEQQTSNLARLPRVCHQLDQFIGRKGTAIDTDIAQVAAEKVVLAKADP